MKHCKKILLSLGLVAATAAHADISPKDLDVKGTIRTPVCTVTQSGGGMYEYGRMSLSIIPQSGHLELEPQTQKWDVDCGEGQTYVSFKPTDLKSGTASLAGGTNMGLDRFADRPGSKIGYYTVTMSNAVVDGVEKSVLVNDTDNTVLHRGSWNIDVTHRSGVYSWGTRNTESLSWIPANGNVQLGSHFEMDMTVKPRLASKSVIAGGGDITEAVEMNGAMLFVYSFGI